MEADMRFARKWFAVQMQEAEKRRREKEEALARPSSSPPRESELA